MDYATRAMGDAWNWMCDLLFRPFDAGRWFAFGFAAWLSSLGRGGFSLPSRGIKATHFSPRHLHDLLPSPADLLAKLAENVILITAIAAATASLWLFFLWLSSHGRFLFMSAVTAGQLNIKRDWGINREQGHSLFLWRFVFSLLVIALAVAWVVSAVLGFPLLAVSTAPRALLISCLAVWLTGFVFSILTLLTVAMLLNDFVVPLMFRFRMPALDAWSYFGKLLRLHWSRFAAYALLKSFLLLGAAVVAIAVIVMTCCIAVLPYVGAVILLPISTYFRAYSLCFLGEFHPDLRNDRHANSLR